MPFASKKQRAFLAINKPEVFKKMVKDMGGKAKISKSGFRAIMRRRRKRQGRKA